MRFSILFIGSEKSPLFGVGRAAMEPKYFWASAKPWAGVTSPEIASTALFGP